MEWRRQSNVNFANLRMIQKLVLVLLRMLFGRSFAGFEVGAGEISSCEGFRTTIPSLAAPTSKGPSSEILHTCRFGDGVYCIG